MASMLIRAVAGICVCVVASPAQTSASDASCAAPSDDLLGQPKPSRKVRSKPVGENMMFQGMVSAVSKVHEAMGDTSLQDLQGRLSSLKDIANGNANVLLEDGDVAEGHGQVRRGGDYVEYLQSVGRLADKNGDERLSFEELTNFAMGLQDADRNKHTHDSWSGVAPEGVMEITLQDLINKIPLGNHRLEDLRQRRFTAADRNGDGRLNYDEYHTYIHPVLDQNVFIAERDFHFVAFDTDDSSTIDFEEFRHEGRKHSDLTGEEFSEEDAAEDFRLHDEDSDGVLSLPEFGALLAGHATIAHSIQDVIKKVDQDGDAHIDLGVEVTDGVHHLLDSGFVEDYFFHRHLNRHSEL